MPSSNSSEVAKAVAEALRTAQESNQSTGVSNEAPVAPQVSPEDGNDKTSDPREQVLEDTSTQGLKSTYDSNDDDALFDDSDDETPSSVEGDEDCISKNDQRTAAPPSATAAATHPEGDFSFYYERDPKDLSKRVAMAFCCANCKCSEEQQEEFGRELVVAGRDDGDGVLDLYHHRRCCHSMKGNDFRNSNTFYDALDKQSAMWESADGIPEPPSSSGEKFTRDDLKRFKAAAERKETLCRNADGMPTSLSMLETNETYLEHQKFFHAEVERRQKQERMSGAIVLDLFGGIGAGVVALKRLEIAISKVIHVEHDPIATHVVRYQHDTTYNTSLLGDGIKHMYMAKFEDIEQNVDKVIREHGPIDIILGGPPCSEYSGLNARGHGSQGQQGQFLSRCAQLLRNIEEKQKKDRPVFWLVENVVFRNSRDENFRDYTNMEKMLGVPHTVWDALDFSPCKRERSFWLNFPLSDRQCEFALAKKTSPNACLEEGWILPGEGPEFEKANTFLASKGRIDDSRMLKKNRNTREKGYLSVLERERMLGFPEGYVERAVGHLYEALLENAYSKTNPEEKAWRESLDSKFSCFSGEPVKFRAGPYEIKLQMSPPLVNQQRDFFTDEEYAKHLLGNSFSIPVVEFLLSKLKDLFGHRKYEGFEYKYCWEVSGPI